MLSGSVKNEYTPVSDVDLEQGQQQGANYGSMNPSTSDEEVLTKEEEEEEQRSLAKKYPEANSQELKFLGALDKAIAKYSEPKISLPRVQDDRLGYSGSDSFPEFLASLKLPTAALIACVGASVTVLATDNEIYRTLFPYVSCILIFTSTIPPLRNRFLQRCEAFVPLVEGQAKSVESKMSSLSTGAIGHLNKAEDTMDAALSPIQEKLDKVTELETMLRTVDPTIDIPDVSDIKEAFDGCTDKIESAFKAVLNVADGSISKVIPPMFRSRKMLEKRLLYPFLAVVLVMQLASVWKNEHVQNAEVEDSSNSYEQSTDSFSSEAFTNDTEQEEPFSQWQAQWEVLSSAVLTYVSTILQLVIAFIVTQISLIVKKLNAFVEKIEGDINTIINEQVGGTFKLVFSECMGGVREKMLKLIGDMEKIEGPLKKAEEMKNAQGMMNALKEKARAEAEEKAKEAIEKAKGETTRQAEEAKEEAKRKAEEAKEEAKRKAEDAKEKAEQAKNAANMMNTFSGKKFGF